MGRPKSNLTDEEKKERRKRVQAAYKKENPDVIKVNSQKAYWRRQYPREFIDNLFDKYGSKCFDMLKQHRKQQNDKHRKDVKDMKKSELNSFITKLHSTPLDELLSIT